MSGGGTTPRVAPNAAAFADMTTQRRIALAALAFAVLYAAAAALAFSETRPAFEGLLATAALGGALAILSAIDVATYRLPNLGTLPLAAAGLTFTWWLAPDAITQHAAAAILGYISLAGLVWIYQKMRGVLALGGGDVKLTMAAGAWVGIGGLPSVLLIASVAALALAIAMRVAGRDISLGSRMPFGPHLAFAFWLVWLFGPLA